MTTWEHYDRAIRWAAANAPASGARPPADGTDPECYDVIVRVIAHAFQVPLAQVARDIAEMHGAFKQPVLNQTP